MTRGSWKNDKDVWIRACAGMTGPENVPIRVKRLDSRSPITNVGDRLCGSDRLLLSLVHLDFCVRGNNGFAKVSQWAILLLKMPE